MRDPRPAKHLAVGSIDGIDEADWAMNQWTGNREVDPELPAYDAMTQYPMRHILVRHEQGATHMADGYARATGRVGVAIATSGPGATNASLGIHTGSFFQARPSLGSWLSYGLGTVNRNLPSFIVLAPELPYAGTQVFANDFLPAYHQGTRVIPGKEPVPNVKRQDKIVLTHYFAPPHIVPGVEVAKVTTQIIQRDRHAETE